MRSASKWIDIGGQFPLQWISKTSLGTRKGNHKRMATVKTLRDFFFMWETQMCSAATLMILDSGKIKSSSPLLITWGRKSTKFSWKYWQTKSLSKVVLPYSLMIKNSPNCQISDQFAFALTSPEWKREEKMISRMSSLSSSNGLKKFKNY